MNFLDTVKGSMMEDFYPKGWDFEKIHECTGHDPQEITKPMDFWHPGFTPVKCETIHDFDMMMGHEIAMEIKKAKDEKRELAMIIPVGPMGMYKWTVYFLKAWNVSCPHVHCFNMDEWSDGQGNTLDPSDPGSFQNAMEQAFYEPLDQLTVPIKQRHFATKEQLPNYGKHIQQIKEKGGKLITLFGIGRMCHIAFWEPQFAGEYENESEWKKQTHRLGAKLHPMTIEQNAITSFKSRTTLVPCRANTVGPGLFLQSDYVIGGCDGALSRGMQWQGMSLWMTLRYGPDMWVPSSHIPTLPGKLFFLKELAGPLQAECN